LKSLHAILVWRFAWLFSHLPELYLRATGDDTRDQRAEMATFSLLLARFLRPVAGQDTPQVTSFVAK